MIGTVELTTMEIMQAAMVGVIRQVTCIRDGKVSMDYTGKKIDDWQVHIIGAIAECAFAKLRQVYWEPTNRTFKLPDVGTFQVRGTEHLNGHLILRERDVADDVYALVTCALPTCTIVGYMQCSEAKQDKFWREDKNAWWVPQDDLLPAPASAKAEEFL